MSAPLDVGLNQADLGFFLIAVGCWLAAVGLFHATPAFVRRHGMPLQLVGKS